MAIARANAPQLTRGARAIAFVKNPNDAVWRKDPAVALYQSILKRFAPGAKATDVYHWYGMTVAWTMVDTLRRAGKNLDPSGPPARRAEPRHHGQPVSASGNAVTHLGSGCLPARHRLPLPLRQPGVGPHRGAVPRPLNPTEEDEDTMSTRTRTAVVALAALAALALASVASAAYTSPKLTVTYAAGNVTRIVASAAVTDDSTARAAIVIPTGTTITATAAPGTKVGTAQAQVSALALGGALLPLAGRHRRRTARRGGAGNAGGLHRVARRRR